MWLLSASDASSSEPKRGCKSAERFLFFFVSFYTTRYFSVFIIIKSFFLLKLPAAFLFSTLFQSLCSEGNMQAHVTKPGSPPRQRRRLVLLLGQTRRRYKRPESSWGNLWLFPEHPLLPLALLPFTHPGSFVSLFLHTQHPLTGFPSCCAPGCWPRRGVGKHAIHLSEGVFLSV